MKELVEATAKCSRQAISRHDRRGQRISFRPGDRATYTRILKGSDGHLDAHVPAVVDRQEDRHGGHGRHPVRVRGRCTWSATCRSIRAPGVINEYGSFLREILHGAGLWVARVVLLIAVVAARLGRVVAHDATTGRRARGLYRERHDRQSTLRLAHACAGAGVFVLVFIVYHLLHLHLRQRAPELRARRRVPELRPGFRVVPVAVFYIVAMVLLGLHLYHGRLEHAADARRVSHPRYDCAAPAQALAAFAALVVIGNISFPLAVLTGVVTVNGTATRTSPPAPDRAEVGASTSST